MFYEKLVRDRIPEIITGSGRVPQVIKLDIEQFQRQLDLKLEEELKEYLLSGDTEELADLVEVVYAILKNKGVTIAEFERIRLEKYERRGGFDSRLFLVSTE